jgi:pimeloyl-ACP methyl ester carboxylesterase
MSVVARTTGAAALVWVLSVVIANVAVEAVPHVRGIGLFPQLRYVMVSFACAVSALGAVLIYQPLAERVKRPRLLMTGIMFVAALVVLGAMAISGPGGGLVRTALAPVLAVALANAVLVPRFVGRPPRRKWLIASAAVLGLIEIFGLVEALASERLPAGDSDAFRFEVPQSVFGAEQRFMDLPSGARIHYVDVGHGDTLVFLHGNPSWSFQWRELIQGLQGSFRCITLDYPGFGLSSAPPSFGYTPREQSVVVEQFIDQLKLRNVTLVMQDWGGPIGMGVAIRRPELVRRVVLGSTWAWRTSHDEPRGRWSTIAGGPIGEFLQVNFNGIVGAALSNGIERDLPSSVATLYRRPFLPVERRGIAAFYPYEITAADDYFAEIEAGLARVARKPALIFWAGRDIGFPADDRARWERTFPDHKIIELPNADHFFFEDTADQVIREIRAFASIQGQR